MNVYANSNGKLNYFSGLGFYDFVYIFVNVLQSNVHNMLFKHLITYYNLKISQIMLLGDTPAPTNDIMTKPFIRGLLP